LSRQDAKSAKEYRLQMKRPKVSERVDRPSPAILVDISAIGNPFLFVDSLGALGVLAAHPVLR